MHFHLENTIMTVITRSVSDPVIQGVNERNTLNILDGHATLAKTVCVDFYGVTETQNTPQLLKRLTYNV